MDLWRMIYFLLFPLVTKNVQYSVTKYLDPMFN